MRLYWLVEIERVVGTAGHEIAGSYYFPKCGCSANNQKRKREMVGRYTWRPCKTHASHPDAPKNRATK